MVIPDVWVAASRSLGLELSGFFAQKPRMMGQIDGVHVDVNSGDKIGIAASAPFPKDLGVGARVSGMEYLDFPTGDREFDARVFVLGSPLQTHPLLDAEMRRLLLDEAVRGIAVRRGSVWGGAAATCSAEELVAVVRRVARLALELATRADDSSRLARLRDRAVRDPLPAIRRASLWSLFDASSSAEARTAFLRALEDADPECRFLGALDLGVAGLYEMSRLTAESHGADLRLRANLHLLRELPEPKMKALFARLLEANQPVAFELARASGRAALARNGAMAGSDSGAERVVAAALGRMPVPFAESGLLEILDRRVAAAFEPGCFSVVAASLGAIGTPRSVPRLTELADDLEGRPSAELWAAARRIQARTGMHRLPGAISLTESPDGWLSDTASGDLSLVSGRSSTKH